MDDYLDQFQAMMDTPEGARLEMDLAYAEDEELDELGAVRTEPHTAMVIAAFRVPPIITPEFALDVAYNLREMVMEQLFGDEPEENE